MNIDIKQRVKRITITSIIVKLYSVIRVFKYKVLSNGKQVSGKPILNSPALINGLGTITFGKNVNLGVPMSPFFFNTYIYIEARSSQSQITIEKGVWINNNACIISDGPGITIGQHTLIGFNFAVYDSDFHDLHPDKRLSGIPNTGKVIIGANVFIGSGVTVLKGVEIGINSIIANGSVVTKSIPANVIAGGNPCKVIREIHSNCEAI